MSRKAQPVCYGGRLDSDEEAKCQAALEWAKRKIGPLSESQEKSFRDICTSYFKITELKITPAGEQRKRAQRAKSAVEKALRLLADGDEAFNGLIEDAFRGERLSDQQVPHPTMLLGTVQRGLKRLLNKLPKKGGWKARYGQYEITTISLIAFWREVTGNIEVRLEHNRSSDEYSGHFFDFICEVYDQLGRPFDEHSLAKELAKNIKKADLEKI